MSTGGKAPNETKHSPRQPDDELGRALERDTAVQGERESDAGTAAERPGADREAPSVRSVPATSPKTRAS